jgi:hypothetical protein
VAKVEQGVLELERIHPELVLTAVTEIVSALQSSHPEIQERVGLPATAIEIHHPATADAATTMTVIRRHSVAVGDDVEVVRRQREEGVQTDTIRLEEAIEEAIGDNSFDNTRAYDAEETTEKDASKPTDDNEQSDQKRDATTDADAANKATEEKAGFIFRSPIVAYLYNRWYSKWTFL